MGKEELNELVAIKKLLVLQLLKNRVPAGTIAKLLDMDAGAFSRAFPVRKLVKETKKTKNAGKEA